MGEKKNSTYPKPSELESQTSIVSLIITGQYRLVYDGRGRQSNRGMTGGHLSEWYAFEVRAANGKVIGEFHVHPLKRGGLAAGNFRLFADHSFGSVTIGRANDWQWLCRHLRDQLPKDL